MRRSTSGSTTASSTPRTTASTAICRTAMPTRSRSFSRPTTARSRKVTYRELYHRVCRLANGLKSRGISKGDRVIIYMPMSIEGVVAMQACARIGATHSVVFGGFSAKSLQERIIDAGAIAVITADEQMRGGKAMPIKAIVDEALAHGRLRSGQDGRRLPAHRQRGRDAGRARRVDARPGRRSARHLRPRLGERRTPAVHPLHLRLDRQAQGRAALAPAAICCGRC